VQTGLAFLPLPLALATSAIVIGPRLATRFGPKVTVPAGLAVGAIGVLLFTRITLEGDYVTQLLPSLIVLGLGLGLAVPTSTNIASNGLLPADTGVGSSLISAVQQVGGALGVAFINSIATTAATDYVSSHTPIPTIALEAAVHGDVIAFRFAAGFFLLGAIITAILIRPGRLHVHGTEEPAIIGA